MSFSRFEALKTLNRRRQPVHRRGASSVSSFYGADTFDMQQMKAYLSSDIYTRISESIKRRKKIDEDTANVIASVAKTWAIQKGAKHFTHWFQPLTGGTAEKHDSFFDARTGIERFKGSELVQQEPDASSFPSGGIRSTFEARGYTAWDPTSSMFIYRKTLCVPTIFVSHTGETLDAKAPLLRALKAVDKAATKVCRLFNKDVHHVTAMLGCEQEYFAVDRALYSARPDLVMTGRTVFGHAPARGQQLDDHYFGSIPTRVYHFMKDFEVESWRLGIPLRTRHNEVAPSQFEVAPLFEEVNVANDHNQLLMDVMDRVAERHDLKILFHEKPFAGLNGSGKHNNWSLVTDTGVNLYAPSSNAKDNLVFLSFFVLTILAVYEHADLLRASVATAGNDFRLGGHEAPPAIMSVFVGDYMKKVLDELEGKGNIKIEKGDNMYMKLGIDQIPKIMVGSTDRNRTSPFAFTGNKFEFRAVGASDNSAIPMTTLNLVVAEQLTKFHEDVERRIANGEEKKIVVIKELRKYIKKSKNIRFEGDGYAETWTEEAKKKKLNNIKDMPWAIEAYLSDQSINMFEKFNVLSRKELKARQRIKLEHYINTIDIESKVMVDLALNQIIPTAISYQNRLIENAKGLKMLSLDSSSTIDSISEINVHVNNLKKNIAAMEQARNQASSISDVHACAVGYCKDVKIKYFQSIRRAVDGLELLVDDGDWPLVKYRELLF